MFHPQGPTFFELIRQALSSTERGYDLLAPKFDLTPFRTPDVVFDAAAAILGPPGSVDTAVDLCCGTGAAIPMLRALCRERVVGVDFSRGMLAEAERRLAEAPVEGLAPVELVHGDLLELEDENAFDIATCFGALGHFRHHEHQRLVAVVARALRPGGRFVFATAERPPLWSPRLWLAYGFNLTMALRNTVWRPPFVMYYLSFLLPRSRRLLEAHGFKVAIHRSSIPELPWLHVVEAELPKAGETNPRNAP